MHCAINEANERIDLKRVDVQHLNYKDEPELTAAQIKQAEVAAAELELADPDDDVDWVDMRRKMRGSFAAFNLARCSVSTELLDHIMMELCKYWANAQEIEDCLNPLLERNILREIQNFRFKLFNVTIDCEPEMMADDQLAPESNAEQPRVQCAREPSPSQSSQPKPKAPVNKRPKSKVSCRRPLLNKLTEARAKATAARMQKHEANK